MGIQQLGLTLGGFVAVLAGGLAFASGVGSYGWAGIYFIVSAEAGSHRAAGLPSGVDVAAIVVGLLVGPTVFGAPLDRSDSSAVPWALFALLATVVTAAVVVADSHHRPASASRRSGSPAEGPQPAAAAAFSRRFRLPPVPASPFGARSFFVALPPPSFGVSGRSTSSSSTIGAASPRRTRVFTIRV